MFMSFPAAVLGFTGLILSGVVLFVVVIVALWAIGIYNTLVRLRNQYENAFSQIDVQLRRRYDLIPNLVEVAKKYMAHEKETLEGVIAARNQAHQIQVNIADGQLDAGLMGQLSQAEGALGGALSKLMAVSEAYPDLKADQNMQQLTEELTSTENKVSFARQAYNDSVTTYENKRESFPAVILAGMFGFDQQALWEIQEEAAKGPVKVSFD